MKSCKHHWSYNKEHNKDTIILSFSFHIMFHKYLLYDADYNKYRTLSGRLLDTKLSHLSYMVFIKRVKLLELYNNKNIKYGRIRMFGVSEKKIKKAITIQLDPMIIARVWQFAKDEGIARQVAHERLIEYGFNWIEERGYKEKESKDMDK